IFTFAAEIPASTDLGTKTFPVELTDLQGRKVTVYIFIDVQAAPPPPMPCTSDRLAVKTGMDADAGLVHIDRVAPTTTATMRSWGKPLTFPGNGRILPYEANVYALDIILAGYKVEGGIYKLLLRDESGSTMIAELPCLCCVGTGSPFSSAMATARDQFNRR